MENKSCPSFTLAYLVLGKLKLTLKNFKFCNKSTYEAMVIKARILASKQFTEVLQEGE